MTRITHDPARQGMRTNHAAHVLMALLLMAVLLLGIYEAAAAIVDPELSIVLPAIEALRQGSPT